METNGEHTSSPTVPSLKERLRSFTSSLTALKQFSLKLSRLHVDGSSMRLLTCDAKKKIY